MLRRRSLAPSVRPYTLRVARVHGGGLWTLEDNKGQLYLAVLSRENSDFRRRQELERMADQAKREGWSITDVSPAESA